MADYGATVDDVRDLLVDQPISATSRPSESTVARWVAHLTAKVAARLGDLSTLEPDDLAEFGESARAVVALGAAAWAADAAHPERASKGDTRYGAVLWERHLSELDALAARAEAIRTAPTAEEVDPDTAVASGLRYSFPPSSGIARAGF